MFFNVDHTDYVQRYFLWCFFTKLIADMVITTQWNELNCLQIKL